MSNLLATRVPAILSDFERALRTKKHAELMGKTMLGAFKRVAEARWDDATVLKAYQVMQKDYLKAGARECTAVADNFRIAKLYHVSDSMLTVAEHAAKKLNHGVTWQKEDFPAMTGIILFETGIQITGEDGKTATLKGFSWQWEVGAHVMNQDLGLVASETGAVLNMIAETPISHRSSWGPLYVFQHQFLTQGEALDHLATDTREDTQTLTVSRVLYTCFMLMEQEITIHHVRHNPKLAMAYKSGKLKVQPKVVVIALRHEYKHGKREEGTGRFLPYKYERIGHWRNQPYGPKGAGLVKRIWISPTWVGDEKLPTREVEPIKVTSLRR